jgi:hypothetical protein
VLLVAVYYRTNLTTTVLGDGACINTGLIVQHRKRPGRPLLKGEEEDNAARRKVRARVEHVIGRMKNYKILRDWRQRGDGLHHAVRPSPACTTSPSPHDHTRPNTPSACAITALCNTL